MAGFDGKTIDLIVNADDYGYFPCVSKGILDLAKAGKLTATGVLANSPHLNVQMAWLDDVAALDVGVHLNLSFKQPLTAVMAEKLRAWGGEFPGVGRMTRLILTRRITLEDVRNEWRAQIAACQQGRDLQFLNSHEHIHMLPVLFPLAMELADEFRIPHVRLTRAEWLWPMGISGWMRNTLMQAMQTVNQAHYGAPVLLGLSRSGRLDEAYLGKLFSRLKPGNRYELMCHPGFFDPGQISQPGLIAYHDWEGELALLQSPAVEALYDRFGIRLAHYRNRTG
ncbi:MAG: ChbG/HpnK family deacetylase [Methylococcales bacterium]|nr:ChbG/HpnK family deacetylase [Methylococcales bacterium]